MPSDLPAPAVGAVVYAVDPERVAAFYRDVALLTVTESGPDHVVLVTAAIELIVVRIPDHVAATFTVDGPDSPRDETPIKLALPVTSFEEATPAAGATGGRVAGPETEWAWGSARVRDAVDPEGNVVQLRVAGTVDSSLG